MELELDKPILTHRTGKMENTDVSTKLSFPFIAKTRKINNSLYACLPKQVVDYLDLTPGKILILSVTKYNPTYERLSASAKELNKEVQVFFGKRKQITGQVIDCDQVQVTIKSNKKNHSETIPFQIIKQFEFVYSNKEGEGLSTPSAKKRK